MTVPANGAKRVRYAEGQRLRAADLRAAQNYLAALDRRHNVYLHAPGVVRDLTFADAARQTVVRPGAAVDASGRDVTVAAETPLAKLPVDAWLVSSSLPAPTRRPGCSDASPDAFQRWNDFGNVLLVPADGVNPPVPPAHDALYLGRFPNFGPGGVNLAGDVRYTSLAGQRADHPAARTRVRIGPDGTLGRSVFAVYATGAAGMASPRFRIDRGGTTTFWGALELAAYRGRGGTLVLAGPSLPPAATPLPVRGCVTEKPLAEHPGEPLTALSFTAGAAAAGSPALPGIRDVALKAGDTTVEQVRVNLGLTKKNDQSIRFAIGATANGAFVPWLTMNGSCTLAVTKPAATRKDAPVSVRVLHGTIEQPPLEPDPTDPQFLDLMMLARSYGLRAAADATAAVRVTFADLPGSLTTGTPFAYRVVIENTGSMPLTVDTILEVRTVSQAVLLASIVPGPATTIGPHSSRDFAVAHAGDTPAGQLTIEVTVCGEKAASLWWQSYTTAAPIAVTQAIS
ncbi:MAG TPA: hypothetical protein VGC72_10365 [Candidatus Elarobacter sp.]